MESYLNFGDLLVTAQIEWMTSYIEKRRKNNGIGIGIEKCIANGILSRFKHGLEKHNANRTQMDFLASLCKWTTY